MEFTEILESIMKEYNLTQTELAKIINVKQAQISEWKKGKAKPGYDSLKQMAKGLNLSADYLLGLEDETGAKTYQSGKYVIGTISGAKIDLH